MDSNFCRDFEGSTVFVKLPPILLVILAIGPVKNQGPPHGGVQSCFQVMCLKSAENRQTGSLEVGDHR